MTASDGDPKTNPYESPVAAELAPPGLVRDASGAVRASFELEIDDLVGFNQYLHTRSATLRAQTRTVVILLSVMLSLVAVPLTLLVLSRMLDGRLELAGIGAAAIVIGVLLYVIFIFPKRQREALGRVYRSVFEESKNSVLVGYRTVTLDGEGITERAALMEQRVLWRGVEWIEATPHAVFFGTSSVTAIVVPRRVFVDEQDCQSFVEQSQALRDGTMVRQD